MTAPLEPGADATTTAVAPATGPGLASLGRNLVVLALLLVAVGAVTDLWAPWTSDDGSYAVSARLVRDEGTWRLPADPTWAEGLTEPAMVNGTVTDEGLHPYVRQPGWVLALVAATSIVPEPYGFYLVQALAAAAAAALAWAVARRLHPPSADLAFWAAAGAPLVVWAFGLWAHATMAAVGGVGALGLVVLAGPGRRSPLAAIALVAAAAAVATALRTEGLVLACASAFTVAWLGWTRPVDDGHVGSPWSPARWWRAAWPSAVVLAAGAGSRLATAWWAGDLAEGASAKGAEGLSDQGGGIAGRVDGALATFASTRQTTTGAFLFGMAALVLAVLAGRRVAAERRVDGPALALAAGWVVVVGVRQVNHPLDHLSGLLVAAPFITIGLLCLRRSALGRGDRALVVFVALYSSGVVATQYAVGGGHEWGGRFLSGGLVAIVVLAATGFTRRIPPRGSRPAARWRGAFLVLVVVVPAFVGVAVTNRTRGELSAGAEAVERADTPIVVSLDRVGAHLAWRTLPERRWLKTTPDDLVALLSRAIAAGEREITVYAAEPAAVAELGCTVEPITRAVLRLTC